MTQGPSRTSVAVVRGDSRREAVAEALALLDGDIKARVPAEAEVLVKPNLVSHRSQLASTHVDAFSATLDALFSAGAARAVIAEGASDATAGFERFGFRSEARGLPVRFFDVNRDETEWLPMTLSGVNGEERIARLSKTVAESPFRVSVALAKTHVTSILTLSMKNMLSSIHPEDRVMMHGFAGGGNGYKGWRRLAVEFLKGDNAAVRYLTRLMGRATLARNAWSDFKLGARDPFDALLPKELAYLRSVDAMNRNLVSLSRMAGPHLSIVDGFLGMHREGPRHGTPIRLGTVIAGTDPVAVDAVSSAVMGFDPSDIGYLVYAHAAGLGTSDLDEIEVVGSPIAAVRRKCVPHSNHRVQRHWKRLSDSTLNRPHFSPSRVNVGSASS